MNFLRLTECIIANCLLNALLLFNYFFQVYIEVLNENDNVPLSEQAVYYPSILEDSPAGTSVLQIRAFDNDRDPEQEITYKILSGNPERFFSINSSTGKNCLNNFVILINLSVCLLSTKKCSFVLFYKIQF